MQEGNVFYLGDFDEAMERELILPLTKEIQKQRVFKDGRIDLYINSQGGYLHVVQHLIELVEMAKREEVTVRTIVPSIAYSAGSILAITGDERYIGRHAEHLIHYGQNGAVNATPLQAKRQALSNERSFKWNLNHYRKYTNVPDLEKNMADDNFYITARDCIKWGVADFYMDKLDIGYVSE